MGRESNTATQALRAEVIAVGSELLAPNKVDTNSLFLAHKLGEVGILLARKSVVGDECDLLASEIRRARESSGLVILSGGLGPTLDDLTRDAASDATGRRLLMREEIVSEIRERFRLFNRPMAEVNKRQAYVLDGAEVLPNPRGTAPGQWLEDDIGILALLPGPPRELKPMFVESCLPRLARRTQTRHFYTHTMRVTGIGESDVDQRIAPIYSPEKRVTTTILSAPGDIQIHLRAEADDPESARAIAKSLGDKVATRLGSAVYALDDTQLHVAVTNLCLDRAVKVAVAESFTGGQLAGRLTDVPGSSGYFAGGTICYCDAAKRDWMQVDANLLQSKGAVSADVAAAMAKSAYMHASEALGSPALGVSTTGYAGPQGGTEDDRVGTAYFGLADERGVQVVRRSLGSSRRRVRMLGVQAALDLIRRRVLGLKIR